MQRRSPLAAWTFGFLLFASGARGQATLSDDFESANFTPPWTAAYTSNPSVTLSPAGPAAHRGSFGLRLVDGDADAGIGPQAWLHFVPVGLPDAGDYYLRTWMRVVASNGIGRIILFQLHHAYDLQTQSVAQQVLIGGYDTATNYVQQLTPLQIGDGGWHLVEVGSRSLGTAAGSNALWVDGVAIEQVPMDFTGEQIGYIAFGEPWADDARFTGTVDFDDARTTLAPPASTLAVSMPSASADAGTCVPLTVWLLDSSGNPAPAPYVFAAGVAAPPGTLSSVPDCQMTGTTSVTFQPGQPSTPLWFTPAAGGALAFSASYVDFLSAPAFVGNPVGADGGVDAGSPAGGDGGAGTPTSDRVGCDCGNGGAAMAILLLAVALAFRRSARGSLRT